LNIRAESLEERLLSLLQLEWGVLTDPETNIIPFKEDGSSKMLRARTVVNKFMTVCSELYKTNRSELLDQAYMECPVCLFSKHEHIKVKEDMNPRLIPAKHKKLMELVDNYSTYKCDKCGTIFTEATIVHLMGERE